MPRKKTVPAPIADVTAEIIETPAAEPVAEPTSEPRTGATYLTRCLLQLIDEAETAFEDEKAKLLEYVAINPRQALERRGRSMANAQAQYDVAMRICDRFNYAEQYAIEHDGATALELIDRDLSRLRDNVLHDFYRASSTCQLHNAIEAETRAAICSLLRDYDSWTHTAANIDADLAAKADQAEALKVELAPGVTMADYEALRRENRTNELRAANIDDVVATFKAAGLKYLGQRKADLIRMLVNHEFKA